MSTLFEQGIPSGSRLPWLLSLLSHDLKLDLKQFDIPESSKYRQGDGPHTGTPFKSEPSDSDCSSDSGNVPLSGVAADLPSTGLEPLFHFDCEGIKVPGIRESNALGLVFTDDVDLEAQTAATSDTQDESLRTPPIHQGARSYECPNQKNQEQLKHLVPQFETSANELLAGGCPQDICLRADVSDASGLKRFQGSQTADTDPKSHKPHRDDDMADWSNTRYPGQSEAAAAADKVGMHAMDTPPNDSEPLRAPRMRPISLPEEDMGGQMETLEGISKTKTKTLAHPDSGWVIE